MTCSRSTVSLGSPLHGRPPHFAGVEVRRRAFLPAVRGYKAHGEGCCVETRKTKADVKIQLLALLVYSPVRI
jgi:hypothetical protein